MDKELEIFCKNCKKYVDAANFVSHRAFCQRNITICKVCDKPIPKHSKKEHEKECHISVICDMCNTSVKKWRLEKHQVEICPKRLVICEYCEVKFPINGIQEHNEFCGSRTEKCKICLKYIMFRHKKKHLKVHMHGENFQKGNGAGEVHQSTMNKITSKTSGKVHMHEENFLRANDAAEKLNKLLNSLPEDIRGFGKEEICPKRLVICEYCEVKFPIDGIQEHNEFCGSRTEKCSICLKYIMFRYKKDHLEVHMHEEKFRRRRKDALEKLRNSDKLLNSLPKDTGGFGKVHMREENFHRAVDTVEELLNSLRKSEEFLNSLRNSDELLNSHRNSDEPLNSLRNSDKLLNSLSIDIGGFGKNSTETCMNYGKKVPVHELSSHKQVCSKILMKQCEYCYKELHCDDSEENHLKNCAVYNHSTISEIHLLSNHFKDLFINENCWDTVLQVGSKEFKVHRAILSARSSVFFAMFQHDTSEKQTGIVKIPDCDPDSFQQFLEYLYCGKLKHFSSDIALPLYIISDKYNVQELKTFCTKYLMKNITFQSMCEVAILADKFDETELFSATEDFFNENFKEVVMTSEWEKLMEKNFRLANKLLIGKAKAE